MSDLYPPTPGSGNNSTDDLYASLLGDIGLAGRVPSSVPVEPVGRVSPEPEQELAPVPPHSGEPESVESELVESPVVESDTDAELGGADYPLAPEVSRSSFVAPTTEDARAYAASSESGDPFETTPIVFDPHATAEELLSGAEVDQRLSAPPTGAFTSPAAQNAQPHALIGSNGRRRPTFDEVLYGTAPGH